MSRIDGDLRVTGTLTAGTVALSDNALTSNSQIHPNAAITRAKMAQVANAVLPVPLAACRVWDSWQPLPATAGNDDLGAIAGTWGTAVPHIESSDSGATSVTQYLGFEYTLPDHYDDGQSITIRIPAKMRVIADTSAALDLEAYLSDGEGAVSGGDLCATAAQSINNAAWDDYDFTITETSRTAGDQLFFRVKVAIVDSATATDHVTAWLGRIQPLIDVRG
jgi:hypothetical protein